MSLPACIGEPISWLRLERHRLGELTADERRTVDAHLAACSACAACHAEIAQALALRPLPSAQPAQLDLDATASRPRGRGRWARRRRWLLGRGAAGAWGRLISVGAVAATWLWIASRGGDPGDNPARRIAIQGMPGIKGGEVALSLVRERSGVVQHDALTFAAEDRWKVLVTCPSARVLYWDVVVGDGLAMSFPLAPATPIACGNNVPLPGAFRLSAAGPAQICLLLGDNPIDRSQLLARLAPRGFAALAREAVCATVRPEGDRR